MKPRKRCKAPNCITLLGQWSDPTYCRNHSGENERRAAEMFSLLIYAMAANQDGRSDYSQEVVARFMEEA
jgi:hypothetical protein